MSNKSQILSAMNSIITTEKINDGFIRNYFSADKFFESIYETGVLKGQFFVESINLNLAGREVRVVKLKKITSGGVHAVREFPTVGDAKDYLNHYTKIYKNIIEHSDKTTEDLKKDVIKGLKAFNISRDYECLAFSDASQDVIELLNGTEIKEVEKKL